MSDLNKFNNSNNKPIDSLFLKGINVAVWEHENKESGNKFRQVTIKKTYKDDKGEINASQSINIHEIPQLIQQLNYMYKNELDKISMR